MSSEKRYKHIDDKIAEAANAANYAFNEASWKKMEALLNKKKDRRKPFFWIFGFLLFGTLILGGGIMYKSVNTNKQSANTASQLNNKDNEQLHPSSFTNTIVPENQYVLTEKNADNSNTVSANTDINKNVSLSEKIKNNSKAISVKANNNNNRDLPDNNTNSTYTISVNTDSSNKDVDFVAGTNKKNGKANTYKTKTTKQTASINYNRTATSNKEKSSLKIYKANTSSDNYKLANKNIYKDKRKFSVAITSPALENAQDEADNTMDINTGNYLTDLQIVKVDSIAADLAKNKIVNKPDTVAKKTDTATKATDKKKKQKTNFSGFYVFGVAGAEANSTKFLSYKKSSVSPRYGFGLGYQLSRHFSLQTGFYAGAKKYIAGPNDYKVKAGSYLSTVKIITVDANCMVYEIPITLQYNWLIKPKTNYYASIGLSSYIMKKEKYSYTFERNYMQYTYPYEYTKNSHLLSSLQFSFGIEKQIAHKLYLQAAPTFNIPLQGVGDGSVKIFTTSLQVGIKYFPF